MTTNLGYGDGLALRQTARNNSATVDIPAGAPVKLIGAVGSSGVGDDVMLVELETAASHLGTFGVAERAMAQGDTAGEGEWGHIVVFGMVNLKSSATIVADTAITVKVTTGDFIKATAAQVDVGIGQGKTLAGRTGAGLVKCFVNFLGRALVGSSGYDGLET